MMVNLLSLFFEALLKAVIFTLQKEDLLLKISDVLHFGHKLLAAYLRHRLQISFHSYKSLMIFLEGFLRLLQDLDFLFILRGHLWEISFPSFVCQILTKHVSCRSYIVFDGLFLHFSRIHVLKVSRWDYLFRHGISGSGCHKARWAVHWYDVGTFKALLTASYW